MTEHKPRDFQIRKAHWRHFLEGDGDGTVDKNTLLASYLEGYQGVKGAIRGLLEDAMGRL
jgi:hypothetical protein